VVGKPRPPSILKHGPSLSVVSHARIAQTVPQGVATRCTCCSCTCSGVLLDVGSNGSEKLVTMSPRHTNSHLVVQFLGRSALTECSMFACFIVPDATVHGQVLRTHKLSEVVS